RKSKDQKHLKSNKLVAAACAKVYEDEFGHMLKGIAGLDEEGLADADWRALAAMSVEQLKARIHMRNAQFSYPLAGRALDEALAGRLKPLAFDWRKARAALTRG